MTDETREKTFIDTLDGIEASCDWIRTWFEKNGLDGGTNKELFDKIEAAFYMQLKAERLFNLLTGRPIDV